MHKHAPVVGPAFKGSHHYPTPCTKAERVCQTKSIDSFSPVISEASSSTQQSQDDDYVVPTYKHTKLQDIQTSDNRKGVSSWSPLKRLEEWAIAEKKKAERLHMMNCVITAAALKARTLDSLPPANSISPVLAYSDSSHETRKRPRIHRAERLGNTGEVTANSVSTKSTTSAASSRSSTYRSDYSLGARQNRRARRMEHSTLDNSGEMLNLIPQEPANRGSSMSSSASLQAAHRNSRLLSEVSSNYSELALVYSDASSQCSDEECDSYKTEWNGNSYEAVCGHESD